MEGYTAGKIVETIDNPNDPNDQLCLVQCEYEGELYQKWFHSSELLPRNDDET